MISVVRDQVGRAMQSKPPNMLALQNELKEYNYQKMQEIWKRERRLKEEQELKTPVIMYECWDFVWQPFLFGFVKLISILAWPLMVTDF